MLIPIWEKESKVDSRVARESNLDSHEGCESCDDSHIEWESKVNSNGGTGIHFFYHLVFMCYVSHFE